MSVSVLRRYTPPTCTLEIVGEQSPLSRWMGQPVMKQLRFQLSLDDPKVPKDEWITLHGSRVHLDALSAAVADYVQDFLSHAATHSALTVNGAIATAPREAAPLPKILPSLANTNGIRLLPQGLLSHELILGPLETQETGPSTRLSTLQLFDLANALDEYTSEIVSLPNLQPQRSNWFKSPWVQVAAVGLVVVGLSTSVAKLMESPRSSNTQAPSNSPGATGSNGAVQLPPGAIANSPPGQLPSPEATLTPFPSPPISPSVPNPKLTPGQPGNQSVTSPLAEGRSPAPLPSSRNLKSEFSNNLPTDSAAPAPSILRAAPPANSTAFDTVPQVAEARRYFQQQWKPPEGLTQTLEYTLVVGSNGAVQEVIPLGQAARFYADRVAIPPIGEPFVSSTQGGQSARIRVVLSPDGKVQTFQQ